MIIVDATIVYEAFSNDALFTNILTIQKPLKAPPKLKKEISGFLGQIKKEFSLSSSLFNARWEAICLKINFEDLEEFERQKARKILASLSLDLDDADYIALCLRYQDKKPTFWTYDSPFVIGDAAQTLRDNYTIFGNFKVR